MSRRNTRLPIALVGAALALSACAVGPDFQRPKPEVPAAWSAASSPAARSQANPQAAAEAAWWTSFGDPELTALIGRAAAEVTAAQAALPQLDRQVAADINQLSRLLDLQPGALKAELETAKAAPPVPPVVPVGLPSDLARRRPDIQGAESRLHAAVAQQGVAVAELYPRLMLTAAGGSQSENLAHLFDWASRFGTIEPQVQLPIFDAGRRRAQVRLQDARAKEAALDYAKTVLGALHEVDDALTAYDAEQARHASLAATVAQNRTAEGLAMDRYRSGVGDFLGVLDAQRSAQQNELQLAQSNALVGVDLVALYKALGGGWDAQPGS